MTMAQMAMYDDFAPTRVCERMYVRANVYLPGSEWDENTGTLREEARRQGRTQAMRLELGKLDQEYKALDQTLKARRQEKGLRMPVGWAIGLLLGAAFLICMILLFKQGMLTDQQKSLNRVQSSIENVQKANDQLNEQISEASDPVTIRYAAARELGMVPSESAQAIHLTAMDTRPTLTEGTINAQEQGVNVSASAE